jgi:hypothetical protein
LAAAAIDRTTRHALIVAAACLSGAAIVTMSTIDHVLWDTLIVRATLKADAADVATAVELIVRKAHLSAKGAPAAVAVRAVSAIGYASG